MAAADPSALPARVPTPTSAMRPLQELPAHLQGSRIQASSAHWSRTGLLRPAGGRGQGAAAACWQAL